MSVRGGIDPVRQLVTVPVPVMVHILVTLCRFDSKPGPHALLGPFIPCERRLAISLFLEIQGRDFWTGF